NGAATISASGGTPSFTYAWTPSGGTAATATGLAAGTYTCTITDANSCTHVQAVTITQPVAALNATSNTHTDILCKGNSTGVAGVNVTGGTTNYTYNWSGGTITTGQATPTASGLAAGTYTCSINDANNCTTSLVFNITQPANSLAVSSNTQTPTGCGTATGTATVAVSGGTGVDTYTWAPAPGGGQGSPTATGLSATNYTVTVHDNNGCPITQAYTIVPAGGPGATLSAVANAKCNASCNGTATVTGTGGTGAGTYTYSWTGGAGTAATATGLCAGTYTCTVTDANNCPITKTVTITDPAVLTASVGSQTNASCNGSSTGSATVSVTGGTSSYTYAWSGGTITTGQGSPTASGLASGTYTCNVTDANNCTTSQQFIINQPTLVTITPASTQTGCGVFTGTATATAGGGTPGYTYTWSPAPTGGQGTPNATGLGAGAYTVTVNDSKNCSKQSIYNISTAGGPTASLSSSANPGCNAACTGTATVQANGGTGAFTYSWTGGAGTAPTANNLCAGTYSCTITDANNCSIVQTVTLGQPAALSVSPSQTNALCNAGASGTATATVSGGTTNYSYSWSPSGGNGATASNLAAGTYTCTVNDANNCSTTQTYTITEPVVLAIAPSQTNLTCNGNNSGTATALVSGGTSSYTYAWAPSGGSAATATGLASGSYTCTVTDAHGCVTTQAYTLTQPATLTATGNPVSATCNLNNGTATVTPTGGSGTYSYAWSPSGGNAATASGLAVGNYTCAVTDSLGCNTSVTLSIINTGSNPVASVSPAGSTSFCQGSSEVIAATGGGNYSWNTGATGNFISVTAPGTYTVYVSNSCGIDSAKVNVTMNPLPVPVITGNTTFCKGDSALLVASGGTTYSWSNGFTGSTQYVYTSGVYTVTATNTCGSTSTSATVTVNSVTANFGESVDSGYYPLPVIFTDSSSSTANGWSWTFGDGSTSTNQNTNNTYASSGTYTVTLIVTSAAGCTSTLSKVIVVRDTPSWIIVPNVFTPNGDGVNDILQISSAGIVEFNAVFYDRWGAILAELKAPGAGWDGRTQGGVMVSNGTYFYILHAKGDDGKVFNLTGFVELIN
ncbi:MAG TPA: gliding motility-associated C-terminal domain-containing protein, partial [Bacteroidia bacterium]|nr:gliding motility-associated C-terminal domain-containing protein [Bacteroidia bacterium]